MSNPFISITICYRDREYLRLKCVLESLNQQTFKDFEVIISDYGSKEVDITPIIDEFPNLNLRIIRTDVDGFWNRSASLNAGHKTSKAKFVMATDSDMLFEPKFFKMLKPKINEEYFVIHRLIYETNKSWETEVIYEAVADSSFWDTKIFKKFCPAGMRTSGGGACQIVSRKVFFELGGYDEVFQVWGGEDSDMEYRAKTYAKLGICDCSYTRFVHMWHPPGSRGNNSPQIAKIKLANTKRYKLSIKNHLPLIRNDGPWEFEE